MEFTLRPTQSEILTYTGGKLGISAVPGSGKTFTLSALAAQLIRSVKIGDEQEVLIVTLVNSAVDNFTSRIKAFLDSTMPFGYRVRTLHGLAHDIVREKPSAVGLEERFAILDEREADFIRKEAATAWLQAHPDALNEYLSSELDESKRNWVHRQQLPDLVTSIALAFIRSAKDNRLNPEKLGELLAAAPAPLPLAEMGLAIYNDYQRALAYRGAVDFDDLIRLAIDLLENDAEFLERLRFRWPYILEDEAQDSSKLQEQILRLLAGAEGTGCAWETRTRPSSRPSQPPPRNTCSISSISKQTSTGNCPNSGRCQPSILNLANQLITWVNNDHPALEARNSLTVPLIRPAPEGDPQPNPPDDPGGVKLISKKYSPEEEVEAVVKSIAGWLPEHPESTLAVLVPRNTRGMEVADALKRRDIDVVELLGSTASTRAAARRLGDIVSALADPQSPPRLAGAYLAWRIDPEETTNSPFQRQVAGVLRKCIEVENYVSPRVDRDWLTEIAASKGMDAAVMEELEQFQVVIRRWQGTTLLPIDQMILTLAQDLFTAPNDLALAHKLALVLRQVSNDHSEWRLPELNGELSLIARNERRFLGFSEEDAGFDPSQHAGKVVVTTMHKAKGLEWDRVYLMSVNNYDFPSLQINDQYISEKWFIRDRLNLEAEALAQLEILGTTDEYGWYEQGQASQTARLDYVRERLQLLYVGITRAKKELVLTWNTGRQGTQKRAIPFEALLGWQELSKQKRQGE